MTLLLMLPECPVPVDGRLTVTLEAPLPCPGDPDCPVECDEGHNYTGVEWMGYEESFPCQTCGGSGLAPAGSEAAIGVTDHYETQDPPSSTATRVPAAVLYDAVLVGQQKFTTMNALCVVGFDGYKASFEVRRTFDPPITEWPCENWYSPNWSDETREHFSHLSPTAKHDCTLCINRAVNGRYPVSSLPAGVSIAPSGLTEETKR